MKTLITSMTLVVATATTVFLHPKISASTSTNQVTGNLTVEPTQMNNAASIDAVFVLDTTSSMSGLIDTAKDKIWSIASTMASAQQSPDIRIGLVAFRDRGDQYVTQTIDLSEDLDSVYAQLMDFEAQGGGDGPESVNQGLYDAVHNMSWSQNSTTYKTIFLVGDAPPHMDYSNDVKYNTSTAIANKRGIIVNTIQCGNDQKTTKHWKRIAQMGNGDFFQVDQSGGAIAVETPYDEDLASLSAKLDDTRLFYGNRTEKARMQEKTEATAKLRAEASLSSQARRSVFNLTESGRRNNLGEQELIEAISSGKVAVTDLALEELPESLKAITAEERQKEIVRLTSERESLKMEIEEVAKKRSDYINETIKPAKTTNSLEHKLYDAIKRQSLANGLTYDSGPDF